MIHQVAEKLRVLANRSEDHDVPTSVGFVITEERNALADFLSRLTRTSKQQISSLDALALLGRCRRDEGVEGFEVVVVMRVDFTVTNAGQSIRNDFVLLDASAFREHAHVPQALHLPLTVEA